MHFYCPNLKSLVGFTRNVTSLSFPMTCVKADLSCSTCLVILSQLCVTSDFGLILRLGTFVSKDLNAFHLLPHATALR